MFARASFALVVVFAAGLVACGTPQQEEIGTTTQGLTQLAPGTIDGLGIELHRIETLTAGQAGHVIYAKDNTHQLSTKWVPYDWRRAADGKNITLNPTENAGSTSWTCTGGDVPGKYRPAECRS